LGSGDVFQGGKRYKLIYDNAPLIAAIFCKATLYVIQRRSTAGEPIALLFAENLDSCHTHTHTHEEVPGAHTTFLPNAIGVLLMHFNE
jgi:hypothetical protein